MIAATATLAHHYSDGVALDSDLFDAHMADTSLLTQLLKGHLWVEHVVGRTLEIGLRYPERVRIERMSFASKLDLVFAHAWLPEEYESALRRVNAVRNEAAHHLDYDLIPAEMDRMIASMSGVLRDAWQSLAKPGDTVTDQVRKWFLAVVSVIELRNLMNEYGHRNAAALSTYHLISALEQKTGGTVSDEVLRSRYGVPPEPTMAEVWSRSSS